VKLDFGAFSDAGPRKANEDSVLTTVAEDESCLIAVADGLGGHFGGGQASALAIQIITAAKLSTAEDLKTAFLEIHEEILRQQQLNPNAHGMATTLTAVKLSGSRLVGAHCGDTRCVLQRGEGIKKLTIEHTEAQRLFEAGKLSKEQLLTYPRRNVLDSALGVSEGLRVDVFEHDLQPGDRVLITSDGVHEILRARIVLDLLRSASSVEEALATIHRAVENAGPEDNFSAACAFVI
jgi:protein phosphatase